MSNPDEGKLVKFVCAVANDTLEAAAISLENVLAKRPGISREDMVKFVRSLKTSQPTEPSPEEK